MSEAEPDSLGGRHRGREVALQVLYAIDLGRPRAEEPPPPPGPPTGPAADRPAVRVKEMESVNPEAESLTPEEAFARVVEHFDVPASARAFANELVRAVVDHATEIDGLVGSHSRNWRVDRMAAVDRNVLRLAVYELRDTQTPVAVVIDEAVDLARRFGSDPSPSFVNGILDAVAREVRAA